MNDISHKSSNLGKKETFNLENLSPELTKELNIIAANYRKPYTEMIDTLSYGKKEYWWDSPLASRNIYLCDAFKNCCLLKLIMDVIHRDRPDEIVVGSEIIKQSLLLNIKGKIPRILVKTAKRKSWKDYLKKYTIIVALVILHGHKKHVNFIKKYKKQNFYPKKVYNLFSSPRIPNEVMPQGFKDRYFPGLLENSDEDILFYSYCAFNNKDDGKKLLEELIVHQEILYFEQYVRKSDYVEVYKYLWWALTTRIKQATLDTMDVSIIMNDALKSTNALVNIIVGILMGRVLCRLIANRTINVKKIFDWYEGQPSSNAMIRRVRKAYPEIPTIAYILSPCGENNLGLYPSKVQKERKVIPEFYAAQGSSWISSVRQFAQDVKCVLAPSFRYQNVFAEKVRSLEPNPRSILIVMPYLVNCGKELLETISEALKVAGRFDIFIKNHPVNANKKIIDYGVDDKLFSKHNISYIQSSMIEAIDGIETVILTMTTATLEVMLSGVHTINYIPRGSLSFTCVPNKILENMDIVYTAEDMAKSIKKQYDRISDSEIKELLNTSFVPVNRKTVTKFLDLLSEES